MKKLIKETIFYKKFTSRIYDKGESLYNHEVTEEEVNAIEIPNGATNGDMIKAMFPDELLTSITSTLWWGDNMSFSKDWWDAPYNGE